MPGKKTVKGPLGLRLLIGFGSVLFCVLLIWLLGFVLKDIGSFRKVGYAAIEAQFIGGDLLAKERRLKNDVAAIQDQISAKGEWRDLLRNNVDTAQRTMNQMMDLQRMRLEKNEPIGKETEDATARAEKTFLKNQKEYENVQREILAKKSELRGLKDRLADLKEKIGKQRRFAVEEAARQRERRGAIVASVKIGCLLPLLLAAGWLFLKKRALAVSPIIYAFCAAVLWHLVLVIHEHFPMRHYKYVALAVAIAVVLKILLSLIRAATRPGRSILLKRYREAYRKGICPICAYPITPGEAPLTQTARALWGGRRRGKTPVCFAQEAAEEKPYTCPSCGQILSEACADCGKVRHALLPNCLHCGAEKTLTDP